MPGGCHMVCGKIASTPVGRCRAVERSHSAWPPFIFEEEMKSSRRMSIQKAKAPKDLAALFREWQELRTQVSEAELAAAQREAAAVEKMVEGSRSPRKPAGRGRAN